MPHWSLQKLFKPTRNPFVLDSLPTPGFSFVAPGVALWAFPAELELKEIKE